MCRPIDLLRILVGSLPTTCGPMIRSNPASQLQPRDRGWTELGFIARLHERCRYQSARLAAAASIEYYPMAIDLRESPAFVAIFLRHLAVPVRL